MGNRAVITASKDIEVKNSADIGIYLHWNGGRDSVEAFLTYCNIREFRSPTEDNFGWARLCQVICNFFGGGLSVGIDQCRHLDCDNSDNGVYIIDGWEIVGRKYFNWSEQHAYDLLKMVLEIDKKQPEPDRLGEDAIRKALKKLKVKQKKDINNEVTNESN